MNSEANPIDCYLFLTLLPKKAPLKYRHGKKSEATASYRSYQSWCGDGTSGNNVSLFKCSGTPGPQINCSLWHNVPGLIHPCHCTWYNTFRLVKNDRDVSMQGHCVSGTIRLGDQRSQNNRRRTHSFGTSRHPTQILPRWDASCVLAEIFRPSANLLFLGPVQGQSHEKGLLISAFDPTWKVYNVYEPWLFL